MLQSLVIMLREGIEAALVVGLALGYIQKTGRERLRPAVWAGLGLALVASVLGALALQSLPVHEELVEGFLMLVAAVFVGATMIWMHRASTRLSGDIRKSVDEAAARSTGGAWTLGLFIFFMTLREGAEAVLFLSAATVSASGLWSLLGALTGLALAVAFAVAFFKGSIQLDLRRFFLATTFILAVLVVELLLHAYHEFSEAGWLPATQTTMAVVGPAVNNSVLFVLAVMSFPLVLWWTGRKDAAAQAPASASDAHGPEARKARALATRRRAWGAAWIGASAVVLALLVAQHVRSQRELVRPEALPVTFADGVAVIPFSALPPDHQQHYVADFGDDAMRFFVYVVKDGPNAGPRACLDACEMCGDKGYVQQQDRMICINCGAEIFPPSLGQSGGCNPIPLEFEVSGGDLVVKEADLRAAAARW